MEDQFNSDSSQTVSERTLTSWDGQSPSAVTPTHKIIYEDEYGTCHGVLDYAGRFFVHNEFKDPSKIGDMRHYADVQAILEEQLRQHGLKRYFTMADSLENFRFCELFGFKTALEVWEDKYEIMVKEL